MEVSDEREAENSLEEEEVKEGENEEEELGNVVMEPGNEEPREEAKAEEEMETDTQEEFQEVQGDRIEEKPVLVEEKKSEVLEENNPDSFVKNETTR